MRGGMLEAVEARSGGIRVTWPVEILGDGGPARTARDARIVARRLGLGPCLTPARSPQGDSVSVVADGEEVPNRGRISS